MFITESSLQRAKAFSYVFIIALLGCARQPLTKENHPKLLQQFDKDPGNAILADFSYAGYHAGKELPPVRKDLPYFKVVDYGAIPNDGKDDIDAIQSAIDAAAKAGGGIVSFPSGTFDFDVNTANRFLHISHSNIIIRGNGSNIEGTVFHDHTASTSPDPKKMWLSGLYPGFIYAGILPSDSTWRISGKSEEALTLIKPASRQTKVIEVEDASQLKAGDTYLLTLFDPDSSLAFSLVYPMKKMGKNHITGQQPYRFQNLVTIEAIKGNSIILLAPVLWDLKSEWKPQLWRVPEVLSGIGIEGIRMKTDWKESFIHHHSDVHDNGWDQIRFSFVKDSWVKNLVHDGATTAVSLSNSTHCVVMDGQIIGNPGHNGFGVNGFSTYNLLINLQGGRAMHTYTIQGHVSGNVFHNCYSEEPSSIDGHGGLGVYNLFDSMYGGVFKNGGSNLNIPPAIGHRLILWNWEMGLQDPYSGRLKPLIARYDLIPGFIAVGVKGGKGQPVFFHDNNGNKIDYDVTNEWSNIEYLNRKVNPSSLYRYQQQKRLSLK